MSFYQKMRSNNYALFYLLLVVVFFFLSNEAQGIRLGNGMIKPVGQLGKILEGDSSLIVEGFRKITLCAGNNRKLLTVTSPIPSSPTPSTRNNEEGNKKGKPMSSSNKEEEEEASYVKKKNNNLENSEAVSKNLEAGLDLVDIAEMDYSPAKRKPPIHN